MSKLKEPVTKILLETLDIFRLSEYGRRIKLQLVQIDASGVVEAAMRGNEISEEQMVIKSSSNAGLPRSRLGLVPRSEGLDLVSRHHSALSHLKSLFTGAKQMTKSPLQRRWERRWTAASGAWFAVLLALLLGAIDWRTAVMVAATTFMLARGGDMLDNADD